MRSGMTLFPEAVSTYASQVDALYLFLVGLTAFFAVLIAILVVMIAPAVRQRRDQFTD